MPSLSLLPQRSRISSGGTSNIDVLRGQAKSVATVARRLSCRGPLKENRSKTWNRDMKGMIRNCKYEAMYSFKYVS